jgi:hypothetical protein
LFSDSFYVLAAYDKSEIVVESLFSPLFFLPALFTLSLLDFITFEGTSLGRFLEEQSSTIPVSRSA